MSGPWWVVTLKVLAGWYVAGLLLMVPVGKFLHRLGERTCHGCGS